MIPCAASDCLEVTRDKDNAIRHSRCQFCEGTNTSKAMIENQIGFQSVRDDAILILSKLVGSKAFQESRRPRVLAMITLKRFTVHFSNDDFIDFNRSLLGQWCLQSLHSSIRELRIAAG